MKTIEERAKKFGIARCFNRYRFSGSREPEHCYCIGATEQREIDIEKAQYAICLAFYKLRHNNSNMTPEFMQVYMNRPFMKLFLAEMKGE